MVIQSEIEAAVDAYLIVGIGENVPAAMLAILEAAERARPRRDPTNAKRSRQWRAKKRADRNVARNGVTFASNVPADLLERLLPLLREPSASPDGPCLIHFSLDLGAGGQAAQRAGCLPGRNHPGWGCPAAPRHALRCSPQSSKGVSSANGPTRVWGAAEDKIGTMLAEADTA